MYQDKQLIIGLKNLKNDRTKRLSTRHKQENS